MKLVTNTGEAAIRKVVVKETLATTGKTLLWAGGLYLALNFAYAVISAIIEDRKLITKEK